MSFIRENPLYKNINGIKPQATLLSIYWGQNAEWYKGSMKHGFEMLLGVTLRHCSEPVPFSFLSSSSLMEVLVAGWLEGSLWLSYQCALPSYRRWSSQWICWIPTTNCLMFLSSWQDSSLQNHLANLAVAAVKQAKVGLAKGGSQAGQRWHLHKRSNTGDIHVPRESRVKQLL